MTRKNEQERFMSYITERQTHESRMAVADFLRKYADCTLQIYTPHFYVI